MRVYELGQTKSKTVLDLDLSMRSLYLLAAPITPQEARDELIQCAEAGEVISYESVKNTVAKARKRRSTCSDEPKVPADDVKTGQMSKSQCRTQRPTILSNPLLQQQTKAWSM
jgi:hypothetical protein